MPEPVTSAIGAKALLSPTVVAGFCGAVVSLRFVANLSKWERATTAACGAIIAQYASPLATYEFGIQDHLEPAISFFIGLYGLSLTAAVYETIKKADIWGFIMSRYGKGGNDGNA